MKEQKVQCMRTKTKTNVRVTKNLYSTWAFGLGWTSFLADASPPLAEPLVSPCQTT